MAGRVPAIRASTVGAQLAGTAPGHDGEREKAAFYQCVIEFIDRQRRRGRDKKPKCRRPILTPMGRRPAIHAFAAFGVKLSWRRINHMLRLPRQTARNEPRETPCQR